VRNMKKHNVEQSDALYIAWAEDRRTGAPKSLREWVAAHPTQAEALIQWASEEVVAETAATYSLSTTEEARAKEIGRQVAARLRARTAEPVRSLLALAREQGQDADALAEQLDLSEPLVMKLERRLIRFATLPAQLMERVADALRVTTQQIQAYLALQPALANGASYRSETVPQAMQQDFDQAIRNDYDLTDDQKQFWLTTQPEGSHGDA